MITFNPNPQLSEADRIQELVNFLSAYIEQFHNGFVRVLSLEGDILTVEMGGRCEQCSLALTTLRGWIEGTVQQFFPQVHVIGVMASSGRIIA